MTTQIADLVATLRADASSFIAGMQQAGSATEQLSSTSQSSSSGLNSLANGLAVASAAAAGIFVDSIKDAITTTNQFDQMIQQSNISFQGLGASAQQASKMTQQGINQSISLGIDPQQIQKSQQLLAGLIGISSDTTSNLQKLAGAAATAQQPLSNVVDQIATTANVIASNPAMGQWQAIGLARQNIESYSSVTKAVNDAKQGAGQTQVFNDLINGLHGSTAAAQEYANTLQGTQQSLKTLGDEALSAVFTPIYNAEEKAGQALRDWAESAQGQQVLGELEKDVSTLIPNVDNLGSKLSQMLKGINTQDIDKMVSDLKQIVPLFTTMAGIGGGLSLGKIGSMLRMGPMGEVLGPIMGAAAGTQQGRQAIMDLAGSFAELAKGIAQALPTATQFFNILMQPLELITKLAAGLISVAASFKPFDDAIALAIALWAGFKVYSSAAEIFNNIRSSATGAASSVMDFVNGTNAAASKDGEMTGGKVGILGGGQTNQQAVAQAQAEAQAQATAATEARMAADQQLLASETAVTDATDDSIAAKEAAAEIDQKIANYTAVLAEDQETLTAAIQKQIAAQDELNAARATIQEAGAQSTSVEDLTAPYVAAESSANSMAEAQKAVHDANLMVESDQGILNSYYQLQVQAQQRVTGAADQLADAELTKTNAIKLSTQALEDETAAMEANAAASEMSASGGMLSGLMGKFGGSAMGVGLGGMMAYMGGEQGGVMGSLTSMLGGGMAGFSVGGPIGALIGGGLGGILSQILGGNQSAEQYQKQLSTNAQGYVSNFNNNNPVRTDNLSDLQNKASAAKQALDQLQQKSNQITQQGGGGILGKFSQGNEQDTANIKAMQTEYDSASTAVKNFQTNVTGAMNATHMSQQQVIAEAQQLGIDFSSIAPGSNAATQAMQSMTDQTNEASAAMQAATASSSAMQFMMGNVANEVEGKTGLNSFTITPDLVKQLQGENNSLKSQGYDTSVLQNDTNQIAAQQGKTVGTTQALNMQQQQMEIAQKNIELNQQLANSDFDVTQATQQVANAQYDLTKSYQEVANSEYDLQKAEIQVTNSEYDLVKSYQAVQEAGVRLSDATFQLSQAQMKSNEAIISQQDALQAVTDSLKGFNDQYMTVNENLDELTPAEQQFGEQVEQQAYALQQASDAYTQINNQYNLMNDSLQQLTDTMQMYQNMVNRPLAGQSQDQQAIQANKMQQDQIQMQINQLELEGVNTQSRTIINLQNQLDVYQKIGDQLQLQYDTTIGNEQFQEQQAEQGSPISFQDAMDAATAMGDLTNQINTATQKTDTLKISVDAAKTSLDALTQTTEPEITALQNLEKANQDVLTTSNQLMDANQGLVDANNQVTDANHSVVLAQQQLQDSQHSVILAQQQLVDANHSVVLAQQQVVSSQHQLVDANQEVQNTYAQMAQNTIANNLSMTQSIDNYVNDYKTQLGNLQLAENQASQNTSNMASNMAINLNNVLNLAGQAAAAGAAAAAGFTGVGSSGGSTGNNWGYYGMPSYDVGGYISTDQLAQLHADEIVLPLGDPGRAMQLLQTYGAGLFRDFTGSSGGTGYMSIQNTGSGGVMIGQGAVQVVIEGVPGADQAVQEVGNAINSTLRSLISGVRGQG